MLASPPLDGRTLRTVLGCFATGIAIVSTRGPVAGHVAVTVNSFASVSLDPPLVLFSLSRRANVVPHFVAGSDFAVSILGTAHESLSSAFARPSTAQWPEDGCVLGTNGCALVRGALAHLECRKWAEYDGGDHLILVGEVTSLAATPDADPLLFFRGGYRKFTPAPTAAATPLHLDELIPGWG